MSCENLYAWEECGCTAQRRSATADELISQNTAFFLFPCSLFSTFLRHLALLPMSTLAYLSSKSYVAIPSNTWSMKLRCLSVPLAELPKYKTLSIYPCLWKLLSLSSVEVIPQGLWKYPQKLYVQLSMTQESKLTKIFWFFHDTHFWTLKNLPKIWVWQK